MQPPTGISELDALALDARVTVRRGGAPARDGKCIVYWMQRAERGYDNHAVDLAVTIGNLLRLPVVVYFAGIANFPHANLRHYAFLNRGLVDVEADLAERNVSFVMRKAPHESHEQLFADVQAAMVIGDENPMRAPESWRQQLAQRLRVPFWTVDTDVVVPSQLIGKPQYGAYIIRPRLYKAMPEFVVPYQNPHAAYTWQRPAGFHADSVHEDMTREWKSLDRSVLPVEHWVGGRHAAMQRLKLFAERMLGSYDEQRSLPELDGTSALSPYLHFGHIGPLTIVLALQRAVELHPEWKAAYDSYINELIAWRELAVNFVKYTPEYDSIECAEHWAQQSMAEHAHDPREVVYSLEQLEHARTHDELWNAAQLQMVRLGWMHNYLRMYWAKKILEWTPSIAVAQKVCIHLNDKYELDGRDPNGYAGIAWAVLGKFDRPWFDRPIFGKIRYMSGGSTGRKFDANRYIAQVQQLAAPKLF
ncbi:MAG: deoxyribodipyrimidine photo-lyase [Acidobacteriota bacterium]|nr:deoxyribodipyrimidine photo-lyase [Acidobacteriota bacterium]